MSRPVSFPNSLTINRDQDIDRNKASEIKAFQNGLRSNDRIQINQSGNTTIYTKHRESVSEKFIRKLENFEKNVKNAWSHVKDLFTLQHQGTESEVLKNIKDTPPAKFPLPEPGSISIKKFNSKIAHAANTIPVFVELQDDLTKTDLLNLANEIKKVKNRDFALDFFATGPVSLKKIKTEFSAFLAFAEAQALEKTMEDQSRGAIDFAKRWTAIPYGSDERNELRARFGESYSTIDSAAIVLAVFDKP